MRAPSLTRALRKARPHITAARTHHIITVYERMRIPVLADKAREGAGGTFVTPFKRHRGRDLTAKQKAANRAYARLRVPVAGIRPPQALADLPQGTVQPQPPHVNDPGRPHPRATTLKKLNQP